MKNRYFSAAYLALEATLIGVLSYQLGCAIETFFYLPNIQVQVGGMWCMASSLIALQSVTKEIIRELRARLLAVFSGSFISGVIAQLFGYGIVQLGAAVFLSVLSMHYLLNSEKLARLASTTTALVMVFGALNFSQAGWINACLRFIQTCMGSMVAILVVLLFSMLGIRKIAE